MNYILSLDSDDFMDLIRFAFKEKFEKPIWERWLVEYHHMSKDDFISFNEYLSRFYTQKEVAKSSQEDIKQRLAEANEIQRKIKEQKMVGSKITS